MTMIIVPNHRNIFWGYLDEEGKIHIKKYVSDAQIENYEKQHFCAGIFDPFYAVDIYDARIKCQEKLRELKYFEKNMN